MLFSLGYTLQNIIAILEVRSAFFICDSPWQCMSRVGDHRTLRTASTPFTRRAARGLNGGLFPVQELISVRARKVEATEETQLGLYQRWEKTRCGVPCNKPVVQRSRRGGLKGKYIIQAFFPSRRCRGKWKINDPSRGGEKFSLSLRGVSFYAAEKSGERCYHSTRLDM